MNFGSVCSGIEAASVAWKNLGWKPLWFSEVDKFCCELLKIKHPSVPNYGDMTAYEQWPSSSSIQLLVGGTPCQSFSVAGLRKGLEDPRGSLMLTFLAIVKRHRPRWVVWENVPGILSSNRGRDFGSFLGALGELGYGWAYRVLDAQWFGVPQRRRCVFVVGHFGDWKPTAKVLFESESVCRNYTARRKAGENVASGTQCSIAKGGVKRNTKLVAQPVYEMHGQDSRVRNLGDICTTVTGKWGTGGGNVPVTIHPAYGIQSTIIGRKPENGPLGNGINEEMSFTLTKNDQHAVAQPVTYPAVFPINTLTLGGRPDPINDARMTLGVGANGDPQFTLQAAHSHAVATAMQVRRLTPVECERLQGFPDNYTNILWRGKSAPDGLRYKALGNSMAVPVMKWIGERIKNELEKTA